MHNRHLFDIKSLNILRTIIALPYSSNHNSGGLQIMYKLRDHLKKSHPKVFKALKILSEANLT